MREVRVYWSGGIIVEVGGKVIALDPVSTPSLRPDLVLVSHAHSDHASASVLRRMRGVPVVMSEATSELLFGRRKARLSDLVLVGDGDEVEVGGVEVEARSAGHCAGSLQYRLGTEPSVVFTGDFNLQGRVILRPARPLRGDVLIMDATYGSPRYSFPSRSKLYKLLLEMVRTGIEESGAVFVAARALGTAQEVTALVNLSTLNVPVVVERRIYAINKVHERCEGEELSYGVLRGGKPAGVVVVPLGSAERYRGRGPLVTCTGWAATWRSLTSLPLSSHSGFDELLEYVRRSGAELVIPAYGFVDEFARHVAEELGVRCAPIRRGRVVSETI